MGLNLQPIIQEVAHKIYMSNREYSPEYWIKQLTDLLEQQSASNKNVLTVKVDTTELKQVLDDFILQLKEIKQ